MTTDFSIVPLGENALTISFGNKMEEATNQRVLQLFQRLQKDAVPFIDVVPAYSSLTLYYDVGALHKAGRTAFEQVKTYLLPLLTEAPALQVSSGRKLSIPVCYAPPFAPDLKELAAAKNLSAAEVIQLHTTQTYRVYMTGFLPGFAYMGCVDKRIATPRRSSPRTRIPAGSVGIAGLQTGIYPLASPGGWNIIGRTPLQLFNKEKKDPVLLQPGNLVTFYSISEDEFEDYQKRTA